jgi:hypothetical protein
MAVDTRQSRAAIQDRARVALIAAVQMLKCAREGQVPDVNPPGSAEEEAALRPVSEQTKVGDMSVRLCYQAQRQTSRVSKSSLYPVMCSLHTAHSDTVCTLHTLIQSAQAEIIAHRQTRMVRMRDIQRDLEEPD